MLSIVGIQSPDNRRQMIHPRPDSEEEDMVQKLIHMLPKLITYTLQTMNLRRKVWK